MGLFWCCCECICKLLGRIYGPEDGQPECEAGFTVLLDACDATFNFDRIRWQIVKVGTDDTVVLEGTYQDLLDRGGPAPTWYMELATYELRVWYEPEGYAAPCDGLPTAELPFIRSITNGLACCPDSCPIDPSSTSSSVTLSGWTDEIYQVGVQGTSGGGYDCSLPPVGYSRYEFNNMGVYNHTNTTNEAHVPYTSGDYGCVYNKVEKKIVLLGDFDTSHQRFYTVVSGYDGTPATASFRVWGYFGALG